MSTDSSRPHNAQNSPQGSTPVGILGVGHFVPEQIVTNRDVAEFVDTTDEWITERTGIRSRHQAAEGENTSDMALKASLRALEMAGVKPEEGSP